MPKDKLLRINTKNKRDRKRAFLNQKEEETKKILYKLNKK